MSHVICLLLGAMCDHCTHTICGTNKKREEGKKGERAERRLAQIGSLDLIIVFRTKQALRLDLIWIPWAIGKDTHVPYATYA